VPHRQHEIAEGPVPGRPQRLDDLLNRRYSFLRFRANGGEVTIRLIEPVSTKDNSSNVSPR
jgi:hypothetical protein